MLNMFLFGAIGVWLGPCHTKSRPSMKQLIANGYWTRFQTPRAVWAGGWLFIGHSANDGIWVSRFDQLGNSAGAFRLLGTEGEIPDGHNVAAIGVRPDGRLIAAYSTHGDDFMRVRISDLPFDVSSWSAEQQLTSGFGITYPQIFYLSSEAKWYLFFRAIDPLESHRPHVFITSDDDGETWTDSNPTILTDTAGTQRPYLQIDSNGVDRIDISITDGHPKEVPDDINSVYHFYYEAGQWFTSGEILLGNPPFDHSQFVRVWDGAVETAWNLDMVSGPNPRMLFDTFAGPGAENHIYRHAFWDGDQWVVSFISNAGRGPGEQDDPDHIGVGWASFDRGNNNIVALSREVAPQTWEIERMRTSDNGFTWGDREPVTSGTVFPLKNAHPAHARGDGPFRLLWMRGEWGHFLGHHDISIFADIEDEAGIVAPPALSFLFPGVSSPEVQFKSFDLISGELIADLPDLTGSFGRLLGAYTSSSFTIPIPMSGKSALHEIALQSTVPGRTMIVAVINDQPAWGGRVIARRGGTSGHLEVAASTLEAYLARRTVQDHSLEDVDEGVIMQMLFQDAGARDIPGVGTIGGINLEIELNGGPTMVSTARYVRSDRLSVYDAVRERSAADGGLEWTIEIVWANAAHTRIRKVVRVAPRIGVQSISPSALFEATAASVFESLSGNEATYDYEEDYSDGRGSTWIEVYSSGEGEDQPTSDPQVATDLLIQGWPIDEHHVSLATSITDVGVLNNYAKAELDIRQHGARVWNITSRWNVYPQLNIDWRLGDDIAWFLTGHRHPNGIGGQGRCIGWELNPEAGTVNPVLLDPLSGGS